MRVNLKVEMVDHEIQQNERDHKTLKNPRVVDYNRACFESLKEFLLQFRLRGEGLAIFDRRLNDMDPIVGVVQIDRPPTTTLLVVSI